MSQPLAQTPRVHPHPAPALTTFQRYQQAVSQPRVTEILAGRSVFSREGPFRAWIVIWLMIFQRLHAVGTLSVAVRELLTGPVKECILWGNQQPRPLSASTSAYSQARSRLPLAVAEKVSDLIFQSLFKPTTLAGLPMPMFLLDGSSVVTRHSKELVKAFPPALNQHGQSHWPVIRVVVAHEVVSGLAVRPNWGPMYGDHAISEQALTKELMGRLPAGCGVMGDPNFGVFSMAYHAQQHNHPCLFRLTKIRAQKLNGGLIAPPAGSDKAICWTPSRADRRTNPEIPPTACLRGRLIALRLKGGTGKKIYFFTTLDLPAEKILELYGYRWNIETDLRWLKGEVRLQMIEAQSKAMVEKELVLAVAAYNLIRATMTGAAVALQVDPRQLSYSQVRDTTNAFMPLLAHAKTETERKAIVEEMLRIFSYCKLPRRSKRRSAPREVWGRTRPFPKRKPAKQRKPSQRRKKVA